MMQEAELVALLSRQQKEAEREAALDALQALPDDVWKLWQQVRKTAVALGTCFFLLRQDSSLSPEPEHYLNFTCFVDPELNRCSWNSMLKRNILVRRTCMF
jgi:hypothetical protein